MEDQKKLSETTKHENSLWISQELFSFPLFPSPNPPLPFPSPPLPLPSSPLPSPLLFLFLLFLFFSFLYTQLKPEVYFSYSMLLFSGTFIFFLFINNPLTANKHSQKKHIHYSTDALQTNFVCSLLFFSTSVEFLQVLW